MSPSTASKRNTFRTVLHRPNRTGIALLGPGFVAAIAYVDPGNFATNFAAGASYGTGLLWVLVSASVIGVLVQYLSAKAGLATGRDLAELCREHFPRYVVAPLWVQAEAVMVATDVAEIVGGAIALNLLLGFPLLLGGFVTALLSFLILALESHHRRGFEAAIALLLGLIVLCFFWAGVQADAYTPSVPLSLPQGEGTMLASAIIGATVMPHAVYAHSALARHHRTDAAAPERAVSAQAAQQLLRAARHGVWIPLAVAGLVNATMLLVAARVLGGGRSAQSLESVFAGLGRTDEQIAFLFAFALLVSGLAASSVGTYAGQVAMAGFLRRTMPLLLRRLCTMAPALLVLGAQVDATAALLWSQIALCLGLPFTLLPLVYLTSRPAVMGAYTNLPLTTVSAAVTTAGVITVNAALVWQEFGT